VSSLAPLFVFPQRRGGASFRLFNRFGLSIQTLFGVVCRRLEIDSNEIGLTLA